MTEHDYRSRILSRSRLSPAYRLVCDYILRNYIVAAMSTASDIAAAVDVDTTTVTRCAQVLGYSGWPELQAQLKAHALSEFQAANGAGAQNYNDALRAWLRYSAMRSMSALDPSDVTIATNAACAYAEAVRLTDYCLGGLL